MSSKLSRVTVLTVTFSLVAVFLFSSCLAETYNLSYQLLDNPNGLKHYRLNVAVSQSLYEYYKDKNHRLSSNSDFAKFVTPYSLKPIAENLWKIYTDDEDFANGVLMIVHQIPYKDTLPAKYPVETIVENQGDCDLFSYIAASILKAGGLDVVLLYYESEEHMNIGVHLSHKPYDVRGQAYYVTYNGVQYYIAECTGDNWRDGWRVGECPDSLRYASPHIITLENCEQIAPGQVTASYKTLAASTITLTASSSYVIQGSTVTLFGKLSPGIQSENITIYVKVNGFPWTTMDTVKTDVNGSFTYTWRTERAGIYYIRASWSGNDDYAGADSTIQNITVMSVFFVLLGVITIILVCIGLFIFLISRKNQPSLEPQPPQIPS
ncbi:hypothetical protein DRO45_03480 [Candidatus Bathyarchaeota archaeon]|nr:MAG: hypothetical protein DRO45_03480 [Candidatus Bathyarchaeota archaeon]